MERFATKKENLCVDETLYLLGKQLAFLLFLLLLPSAPPHTPQEEEESQKVARQPPLPAPLQVSRGEREGESEREFGKGKKKKKERERQEASSRESARKKGATTGFCTTVNFPYYSSSFG